MCSLRLSSLIQVALVLTNTGELDLLRKVYGTIVTTVDIAIEFGEPLPDWVIIEKVADKYRQQLLEMQIDKGESSAISEGYRWKENDFGDIEPARKEQ